MTKTRPISRWGLAVEKACADQIDHAPHFDMVLDALARGLTVKDH